jgi:hypothetical protein
LNQQQHYYLISFFFPWDRNTIDTYSELKTELLYGDHVEAVGYLNQCEGAEALGRDSTVGYQIQRFNVINEGLADHKPFNVINLTQILTSILRRKLPSILSKTLITIINLKETYTVICEDPHMDP